MSKFSDVLHDNCGDIRAVADDLDELAEAFFVTGNLRLAHKLQQARRRVVRAQNNILAGFTIDIHQKLEGSETNAGQEWLHDRRPE